MAETVLSRNPQKITVPADTADHTIAFDDLLPDGIEFGSLLIDNISGSVRFNVLGSAADAAAGTYTSGDRVVIQAQRGRDLHYSGVAGSETFNVSVV
jgi:hypothetical protein